MALPPFTSGTRIALFLTACVGSRLALAWVALHATNMIRLFLTAACAAVAVGLLLVWALRLRPAPPEAGGVPAWWDALRPVHAALYAGAAVALWRKRNDVAAGLLLADVVMGLIAFTSVRVIGLGGAPG